MSDAVKKKLFMYLVFIVVGVTAGFGVSMAFDPILDAYPPESAEPAP